MALLKSGILADVENKPGVSFYHRAVLAETVHTSGKLVAASAAFAGSFINTRATRAPVSEKIYTPPRRGGRISPRFMNTGRYS